MAEEEKRISLVVLIPCPLQIVIAGKGMQNSCYLWGSISGRWENEMEVSLPNGVESFKIMPILPATISNLGNNLVLGEIEVKPSAHELLVTKKPDRHYQCSKSWLDAIKVYQRKAGSDKS